MAAVSVKRSIGLRTTYLLDSDLSSGHRYSTFEKAGVRGLVVDKCFCFVNYRVKLSWKMVIQK